MPRKKRSQKLAERETVQPIVERIRAATAPTEPIIGAFCPVCGHTIPEKRAIKQGYVPIDHVDYFDSIDWDANKPFGVSFAATGKGSLKDWRHISPEDAPELFQKVRGRFVKAIKEWMDKGWLSKEEIPGC